jgi:TolB protein
MEGTMRRQRRSETLAAIAWGLWYAVGAVACAAGAEGPDRSCDDAPSGSPLGDVGESGATGDAASLPLGVVAIDARGSLQNPCFSPDGRALVVTEWLGGYNRAPARLLWIDLATGASRPLTPACASFVNLPGACFHGTEIVYASDARDGRDEIYVLDLATGRERRVTDRPDLVAFEPSFSPDGAWIVFESHRLDDEGHGALFKVRTDGTELTPLTDGSQDDRQPNWSPTGDRIVFQSHRRAADIEVFTMDTAGGAITNVTAAPSEDTDASFAPDGRHIVFSSDRGGLELAALFVVPTDGGAAVRVTTAARYEGAASWSPNGRFIAYEARAGDPDGSAGTQIVVTTAPPE